MPTYTYVCAACGHRFDHMQSMTAKLLRKCPECGQRKLERMIGAGAGLIFKGSGFYITDYRSGGGKPAAGDAAGGAAGDAAKPASDAPGGGSKPAGGDAGAGKKSTE